MLPRTPEPRARSVAVHDRWPVCWYWHAGGSFYFHRAMWKRNPFRAKQKSMDSWFIADNDPRLVQVCAADEYLVVRHGGNHWNAMTTGRVDEYFSKRTPHPRRLQDLVPRQQLRFYRSRLRLLA